MKIYPITNCYSTNSLNSKNTKNNPTFGYCEMHMRQMELLNDKFSTAITSITSQYAPIAEAASKYHAKISKTNSINKAATQMLAQYANWQYSMAEVIPSYAVANSPKLVEAISKNKTFNNPIDLLINIANLQDLKTQVGIDKNTGRYYTDSQMRKSKANTQLYTAVLLLEMLDKNMQASNLSAEVKVKVLNLRKMALDSISEIYGESAFERIQTLKQMGKNASVDDKRASLKLVQEFDTKAKELKFNEDFNTKLNELIDYINKSENRKEVDLNSNNVRVPAVTLSYHTHPEGAEHNHSHEYMHEHGIAHEHEHKHDFEK